MAKNSAEGKSTEPFEVDLEIREREKKIKCLRVKPGKTLATLSISDFEMPVIMDINLSRFLVTLWTEAMLAWVEENKHLMKEGTKIVYIPPGMYKVTGLLYNGELCGWGTYVSKKGLMHKSTFLFDKRVGRSKCTIFVVNDDCCVIF